MKKRDSSLDFAIVKRRTLDSDSMGLSSIDPIVLNVAQKGSTLKTSTPVWILAEWTRWILILQQKW